MATFPLLRATYPMALGPRNSLSFRRSTATTPPQAPLPLLILVCQFQVIISYYASRARIHRRTRGSFVQLFRPYIVVDVPAKWDRVKERPPTKPPYICLSPTAAMQSFGRVHLLVLAIACLPLAWHLVASSHLLGRRGFSPLLLVVVARSRPDRPMLLPPLD